MKKLILLISFMTSVSLFGQVDDIKTFDFPKNTKLEIKAENYPDENAVILNKTLHKVYVNEENQFMEYTLVHKKVLILNDKGQELYNKVYISQPQYVTMVSQKARVINGDKIVELNENDIKEAIDNENNTRYKYFALENVQKGSIVEYFWVTKVNGYVYGTNVLVQEDQPIINYDFKAIVPKYLGFKFKSYNGLPEVTSKEVDDVIEYQIKDSNIVTFTVESNSLGMIGAKSFIYKLESNSGTGKNNLVSYSDVAKNVIKTLELVIDKKNTKSFNQLIKLLPADISSKTPLEQAKLIENTMKVNFTVDSRAPSQDLATMLKNKVVNLTSAMQLYILLFDKFDIEYQVVFGTDREEKRFDPDFESYYSLSEEFFYLPTFKVFISPEYDQYRLPFIPAGFMYNNALFIEKVEVGNIVTGLGKIKFIDPLDYTLSVSNMTIDIDLNATDLPNSLVKFSHDLTGYLSNGIGAIYVKLGEEKKKEIREYYFKNSLPNTEPNKVEITSTDDDVLNLKPFTMYAEFPISSLLDMAGNEYLFRIGEILGPQVEMYSDKKRTQPIDNGHNRTFNRVIKMNVPDGLMLEGLEALKINIVLEEEGKILAQFVSDYSWKDKNTLEIMIFEDYRVIEYSLENYEKYKAVVNAAADFNKIVCVIKKK